MPEIGRIEYQWYIIIHWKLFSKPGVPNLQDLMIWGRAYVIIVAIKITTNIMCLNYWKSPHSPTLWKNFLPQNQPLGPQRLGTSALSDIVYIWYCLYHIESVITSIALKKRSLLYQSVSQSVQLLSHVLLFVTPWTAACQASPSITNS